MKTRGLWHFGIIFALAAGCQSPAVAPGNKAIGYKPTAPSATKSDSSTKQYEGQQTSYTTPRVASDASDDPSALEKLGTGTKGIFTRAGQALSPAPKSGSSANSWGSPSQTVKKSKKSKKPSALYTWFHPEPKPPKTLKEWMSMERPDP